MSSLLSVRNVYKIFSKSITCVIQVILSNTRTTLKPKLDWPQATCMHPGWPGALYKLPEVKYSVLHNIKYSYWLYVFILWLKWQFSYERKNQVLKTQWLIWMICNWYWPLASDVLCKEPLDTVTSDTTWSQWHSLSCWFVLIDTHDILKRLGSWELVLLGYVFSKHGDVSLFW